MFGFVLLFAIYGMCRGQTLKFDDVIIANTINSFKALPRPYNDFIFRRVDSGFPDDNIPVFNTTNYILHNPTVTFYQNTAISPPNIILTTGVNEKLSISKYTNGNFKFNKLYMTSIFFDNMGVTIDGYRNGNIINTMTTNLTVSVPLEVILNWRAIDHVIIRCSISGPASCYHIAYDNIEF